MTINDDQLERLFTKLGEMHSDIKTLERQYNEAREERVKLRGDLTALKTTVSRAIGWGTGAGAVVVAGISIFT